MLDDLLAVLWTHPQLCVDVGAISVALPRPAFHRYLRSLGALMVRTNRLSPRVYELIRPEFDCLAEGLGRVLGQDLGGPSWVQCACADCQRRAAEFDRTPPPGRNPLDDARAEEIVREVVRRRKHS